MIVAALVCVGLGWWQWGRFESASGTAQNLGYALQWPVFAGFVIFSYFRFVRLERETAAEDEETPDAPPARSPRRKQAPREIPPGILPDRPAATRDDDPVLAEYNKYLAELHAQDVHEQMHAVGLDGSDTERRAG